MSELRKVEMVRMLMLIFLRDADAISSGHVCFFSVFI